MEVRATVAIDEGEEITDHYVTPLNGTHYRRSHLKDGWFFDCDCQRCGDPTENGAMTSAFLCTKGVPMSVKYLQWNAIEFGVNVDVGPAKINWPIVATFPCSMSYFLVGFIFDVKS